MSKSIQFLLKAAFEEKEGAAQLFFESLLESEVFIPVKNKGDRKKSSPLAGPEEWEEIQGFILTEFEGNQILTVFSEESFVGKWAEKDLQVETRRFLTLLRSISPETWIYVDAGQDFGREISPWEIGLLKAGPEGIAAIVQEEDEGTREELEIDTLPEGWEEFRSRMGIALEAYIWVEEARLVCIRQSEKSDWTPMVSFRINYSLQPKVEKKEQLFEETRVLISEYQNKDLEPVVLDDLAVAKGPYNGIFKEVNPFYLRQKISKKKPDSGLLSTLKSLTKKNA